MRVAASSTALHRSRSGAAALRRRLWIGAVAVAGAVALSACSVNTKVALAVSRSGAGTVAVTVTLDRQATAAVGDVAGQLQTSDLARAGWRVTGPSSAPDGATVITATHRFDQVSQVPAIVDEVGGPFHLTVMRDQGPWSTSTRLLGTVDLRCGLACFSDPGLASKLGSPTGVTPRPGDARNFAFTLAARLPGQVRASNAASRSGGALVWHPALGRRLVVTARARVLNLLTIAIGGAIGFVLLVGVVLTGVALWRRRARPAR